MEEKLTSKAQNYYLLGMYAEKKLMNAEAVANYFKSLFALADLQIRQKAEKTPKDHTERFALLKQYDPFSYEILDSIFFIYRETYTKEISKARVEFIRGKLDEIFNHIRIKKPAEKDI